MRSCSEQAQTRHLGVDKCVRCAATKVLVAEVRDFARSYGQRADTHTQSLNLIAANNSVISFRAIERCARRRTMVDALYIFGQLPKPESSAECAQKRRNRFV
jgi:hypothetical protein